MQINLVILRNNNVNLLTEIENNFTAQNLVAFMGQHYKSFKLKTICLLKELLFNS